jgi:hypothetical protein
VYDGLSYHEIALYFLIRFPPDSRPLSLNTLEATDGDTTLHVRWASVKDETLARRFPLSMCRYSYEKTPWSPNCDPGHQDADAIS